MNSILIALMAAVVVVLVMGIWQMARGRDPQKSNRLMVWRVGLQGLAVLLLGVMFLTKH